MAKRLREADWGLENEDANAKPEDKREAKLFWVWEWGWEKNAKVLQGRFRVRCWCDEIVDGDADTDPNCHGVECWHCQKWIEFESVSYCKPLAAGMRLIRGFHKDKGFRWMLKCQCTRAHDVRKVYCAELCPECDADLWPNDKAAYKRCH